MNRKVRIAYTANDKALFTPRGQRQFDEIPGFIRRMGRTISGYATTEFNKPGEYVFYPTGMNREVAYAGE